MERVYHEVGVAYHQMFALEDFSHKVKICKVQ